VKRTLPTSSRSIQLYCRLHRHQHILRLGPQR